MENTFLDIDPESSSIQTHLGIIQNVIQRMSSNSSACKAWCVSLVAAVLVLVADKGKPEYAWIALLPIVAFAALDTYYLALEKAFRSSYNAFIRKLHNKQITEQDLYSISPVGKMSILQVEALRSFSIWGFYLSLAVLVWVTKATVLS
ncbi:hypothetical protein XM38_029560 [Halomicronema hongdechloris C2206]|uniref:Uncharacterized protein n=1 Tax=Halomicronema hongdechloris C2206 TaxID=1641165 RepID=A0A1Z3HP06_9CYAN|nr:hypothetical protein [Halomicronema hongdechloris]ASC72002.1 hypothetical protein XM38_029560 [Halomicronema hongdechloris C2206]